MLESLELELLFVLGQEFRGAGNDDVRPAQ